MREERKNVGGAEAKAGEAGFALVLAIMSLMLLTFLGLTLAATTSTELQIATNYRWSQQALYNAEAGVEAAKTMLRGTDWVALLPIARVPPDNWRITQTPATPAVPATSVGLDAWGNPYRNWENGACDARGGRVGYGVIYNGLQNVSTVFGQQLNGSVTVWIRRDVDLSSTDGTFYDETSKSTLVLTAEGIAPFTDGNAASAFGAANRAVRVLEVRVVSQGGGGDPCASYSGQGGGAVSGSGFWGCGALTKGLGKGIAGAPPTCAEPLDDASRHAPGMKGSENAGTCVDLGVK